MRTIMLTSGVFCAGSPVRAARWAQNWKAARLNLRHDERTNAFPAERVSAGIDACDRFFWKRVHAHSAVKHVLRSSSEFCALRSKHSIFFVELELQHGSKFGARGRSCITSREPGRTTLNTRVSLNTIYIKLYEVTDVDGHDPGLNDWRKAQMGGCAVVKVVGAKPRLMLDWGSVNAMVSDCRDKYSEEVGERIGSAVSS